MDKRAKTKEVLESCERLQGKILELMSDSPVPVRLPSCDLLKRGNEIQKTGRRKLKCLGEPSPIAAISMCKMKKGRGGAYSRDGASVEVIADRCDTYNKLLERGCKALHMPVEGLSLYTVVGAVVQQEESWTLGDYLRKLRRSPIDLKLGIGQKPAKSVSKTDESSGYSTKVDTPASKSHPHLQVYYTKDDSQTEIGITDVFKEIGIIDGDAPFPEHLGYQVSRITVDGVDLLRGFEVKDGGGENLNIVHQSTEVCVDNFDFPVVLYCIPSVHSPKVLYSWELLGKSVGFPCSPVITVGMGGMYKCTVFHEKNQKVSDLMWVRIKLREEEIASSSEEDFLVPRKRMKKVSSLPSVHVKAKKRQTEPPLKRTRQKPVTVDAGSCMEFTSTELCDATKNYSKKAVVGQGGFGKVYRCVLRGSLTAAIKVLSQAGKQALLKSKPSDQFKAEVTALNRFRHPNILQLCGFCQSPPILVFEFMANGSLYSNLHSLKETAQPLCWETRKSILIGTCKGLVYLHNALPPTVHQDIKSANILLDESWKAKLADFGFSIKLPHLSGGTTMFSAECIARTEGYYPSEITSGRYSDRSDVYCYGVVVLETFSGQLVFYKNRADCKLVDHVQDELKTLQAFESIRDTSLPSPDANFLGVIYNIISKCLMKHSARPSSSEVLAMWE